MSPRLALEFQTRVSSRSWDTTRSASAAEASRTKLAQLDPPQRASRCFAHHDRLHSAQPDAFAILRRGDRAWHCFIEWERRAVPPAEVIVDGQRRWPLVSPPTRSTTPPASHRRPRLPANAAGRVRGRPRGAPSPGRRAARMARVDRPLLVLSARALRNEELLWGGAWRFTDRSSVVCCRRPAETGAPQGLLKACSVRRARRPAPMPAVTCDAPAH